MANRLVNSDGTPIISSSVTSKAGRTPYFVQSTLDFSKAATIASSDVVGMLAIPARTVILHTGLEIMTAMNTAANVVPFSMGMYAYTFPTASGVGIGTGDQGTIGSAVDADEFIAEIDLDDTAAGHVIGSILKNAANSDIPVLPYLNDVDACIALTAGSITAAPTSGIFRVYATLMDVSDVGDLTSETADRDTLA